MRFVLTDEECVRESRIFRRMPWTAKVQDGGVLLSAPLFTLGFWLDRGTLSVILWALLMIVYWLNAVLWLSNYFRGLIAEGHGIQPAPPPRATLDLSVWKIVLMLFAIVLAFGCVMESYARVFHPSWGGHSDLPVLCFMGGNFLFVLSMHVHARFARTDG